MVPEFDKSYYGSSFLNPEAAGIREDRREDDHGRAAGLIKERLTHYEFVLLPLFLPAVVRSPL
ncbi:hypothetical protein [Natrinema soli]|uniref:hypothetical protein n=1 Tax=Natrinema soli TaxID=1930624 RepID=UPI00236304D0|nr:hypothetical protein [Natrinema soli]